MYVDAHVHLYEDEYMALVDEILKEAFENKVEYILSVSIDYDSSLKNIALGNKRRILLGLGIHPWTAIYKFDEIKHAIEVIETNIHKITCIGEVGLDKKYTDSAKFWERQVQVFKEMIELSIKYDKPLNIHSRKAAKDVLNILNKKGVKKAYFHWYTDDLSTLKQIIDNEYYVGFTPSVTYSKKIIKILRNTPIEYILTETDGPVRFYGPLKNILTKPIHVRYIIEAISDVKEIDREHIASIVKKNFINLFIK